MKKGFVAITAAIALAASSLIGTGMAGLGPLRGLPDVVFSAGTQDMYNITATLQGVNGSAMCVACHTRNPSKRTMYNAANTAGTYVGSHFVTNNFNDTSKGGGYTDVTNGGSKLRSTRTNPLYMAGSTATATWAGVPKYGLPTYANTTNPSADAAQMICESCHNIVKNIGAAKLLATGFANGADNTNYTINTTSATQLQGHLTAGGTTVPALCIGCHSSMTGTVSAEWQLHPQARDAAGTVLGSWSGTHHHRNTGTAPWYGSGATPSGTMSNMDRAYYPAESATGALQMWGAKYGELGATARALTYESSVNKKMKGSAGNLIGVGIGQLAVNQATQVLCTNCHRAHNAVTSAGGTILMVNDTTRLVGTTTTANAVSGMGVLGREAHLANTNPLCLACHQ